MKKVTTRIIFKYKEELYKYLNISASSDNSFHFHLYEEADKEYEYHTLTTLQDGRTKIDIKNSIKTDFIRNKFTFHPSGILHSSDKNRKRFKDGIIGIAFNEIEFSNLILLLAPKKIDYLMKSSLKKNGINLIIELDENQNPFTLNFEVFRKSNIMNLKSVPVKINHGPHKLVWPNLDFGLRFYTQDILGKPVWPDSSVVLKRIK